MKHFLYNGSWVLLGALALLTRFHAPTVTLWAVRLGAIEFGHWLVFPALALAWIGLRGGNWVGALVAAVAAVLFLLPLYGAVRLAGHLPEEMAQAFGPLSPAEEKSLPPPFSFRTLWLGKRPAAAPSKLMIYAERDGKPLHLRFYPGAKQDMGAPCIIVIHGGGWNSGSLHELPQFDRFLADRGYAVAKIDYRLAPGAVWPAQREDTWDAVRFLQTHAAELGIDPANFVLMGRSAGGQIAEAAAYEAPMPIRACIAFYGPADMNFAFRYADPHDVLNSYKLLVEYLGGTPEQAAAAYDSASSIDQVGPHTPPTLLLHGRKDELVWFKQSERLDARLREAGAVHLLIPLDWATHAFDFDLRTPGGQIAAYAVSYFLAATLNR